MAAESTNETALTLNRLSNTSKINKETSTKSFIESQARYLPNYAAEGKKAVAGWVQDSRRETDAKQIPESKNDKLKPLHPSVGFSSPILKPRVPGKVDGRREGTDKRSNKENAADKESTKEPMKKKDASQKNEVGSGPRKQKAVCPSDDEHVKRLEERKERRRIKKSIVTPKDIRESDEESDDGSTRPKKSVKRKSKPSKDAGSKIDDEQSGKARKKLPAGLALMHGFNASNVGKQRLTVNNISSSGVFSKGKASRKSKVDERKPNVTKPVFDEAKFLGVSLSALPRRGDSRKADERKRAPSPAHSISDDSSSTSSESDTPPSPQRKKYKITNKTPSTKKQAKPVIEEISLSKSSSSVVKSSYQSEVWDIELDVEDSVLGRDMSSKAPSASVVVNCKSLSWGAKVDQDTVIDERSEVSRGAKLPTAISARSSSLAPSQSASQLPVKVAAVDSVTISRFFGHDWKENSELRRLEECKGVQASRKIVPATSPPKHAIITSDEEMPLGVYEREVAPVKTVSSIFARDEDAGLELQTPWHEHAVEDGNGNAFYQDPLDLSEDLNNDRLLSYNTPPDTQLDMALSEWDLQENRDVWTNAVGYDNILQAEQDGPDDFLGLVDDDSVLQHFDDSPFSDGDFYDSFDVQDCVDPDSTLAYDCYIAEDDAQAYDALDDSSKLDAWLGVQALVNFEHEITDVETLEEEELGETQVFEESSGLMVYDEGDSRSVSEPLFSQGRALLLGMDFGSKGKEAPQDNLNGRSFGHRDMSDVEKSVARNLRGHWHPVKY